MIRRRTVLFPLLAAIALCGCNSEPGPVVPSVVDKPKAEGAVDPAVKTSEGGHALSTTEPAQGGPPTKATP